MNKKEIEELIKFVAKSGVSEVSLEQKDFKITIKNNSAAPVYVQAPSPMAHVHHQAPAPQAVASPAAEAQPKESSANGESKLITVRAPMIGTFYRSSGPEKAPFVNVGDDIKTGKVICIIEAMKLFNEIESEVEGKIVKVLVENATPVEYDQPLFLVEPN